MGGGFEMVLQLLFEYGETTSSSFAPVSNVIPITICSSSSVKYHRVRFGALFLVELGCLLEFGLLLFTGHKFCFSFLYRARPAIELGFSLTPFCTEFGELASSVLAFRSEERELVLGLRREHGLSATSFQGPVSTSFLRWREDPGIDIGAKLQGILQGSPEMLYKEVLLAKY